MGKGWFGESGRHSKAARGIKTVTPEVRRAIESGVEGEIRSTRSALLANRKMDALINWIDRKLAWGTFANFSIEDRNYFVQELGDIMADLENVKLSPRSTKILKGTENEFEQLLGIEQHAASQLLRLETIRERLHAISTRHLRGQGYDVGHVDEIEW